MFEFIFLKQKSVHTSGLVAPNEFNEAGFQSQRFCPALLFLPSVIYFKGAIGNFKVIKNKTKTQIQACSALM